MYNICNMEVQSLWWNAVPHSSQILDLYQKFRFDLWRNNSDLKLRQEQNTKPSIQIYPAYYFILRPYFEIINQYT